MRPHLRLLVPLALLAAAAAAEDNVLTPREKEEGWILLFDGKTLDGWKTSGWKPSQVPVQDSSINPHGCGDYMMVHERTFSDFVLSLDFRISEKCNSGVFIRTRSLTPLPGKDVGFNGLEVAIDDTRTSGYTDTGALYDLSRPSRNAMKKALEWNRMVITCRGSRITIELNGEKVNDVDLARFTEKNRRPDGTPHKFDVAYKDHPREGYVGLQDHGSNVWFKNLKLKPLAGAVEEPWGRTILAQPFDRAPFREVRVPAWVEDTVGVGYTLSGMDSEKRARAAEAGVTISELGFVDPFYAYYESSLLKRRSPHVPLDRLEKDMAEYRKLGVRILGVYPPCLQGEVYETHPEWRRVTTRDGKIPQIDMVKYPHGGMLCMLGPYGDFFIDVLVEIATKFPVDAFSFDGLHHGGFCYCEPCRKDYLEETGQEIPAVSLDDPAFRRYQHWADRRMEKTVQKAQARLKAIRPDMALVTWTTNAGRFGHLRDIPRNMPARMNLLLDAPDQEFWLDETNRGATVVPALANAYLWAVTNHRVAFSEPYLMTHGNPYGKDSFPAHEVHRRMLLSVAYGVGPSIAVGQPAHLQPAIYQALAEVQKRKPWITHKSPEPWAALVLSDNTRVLYGRSASQVEDRYLSNVLGVFRTGIEEHLPITIVNDWNLTPADLAPYKVLILPNTACLDAAQIAAVRGFVEGGGGLVATLDASLCDEFGDPRKDFGLADVLGVSHRGIPKAVGNEKEEVDINFAKGVDDSYWQKRKSIFDFRLEDGSFADTDAMRSFLARDPVTFKGPAVSVETKGGGTTVAATLQAREVQGAPRIPAVVSRTHGKGRVVYLAGGFDSAYYLYPYPYQRTLLARAVRWAAASPPPVEVKAPMCVHANVFRQRKDGSRLIVHLYNDVNTTAFHALPDEDVPLREETIPIHGIEVRFRKELGVKKVHLEPGATALALEDAGAEVVVRVPRIDIHAMVVAEVE